MVRVQPGRQFSQARLAQPRQHVPLFVLMVRGAGDVEIAQHVGRRVARLRIRAVLQHMGIQTLQKVQAAPHALMAGGEHFERLLEAHGGPGMQDDSGTHATDCLAATMAP